MGEDEEIDSCLLGNGGCLFGGEVIVFSGEFSVFLQVGALAEEDFGPLGDGYGVLAEAGIVTIAMASPGLRELTSSREIFLSLMS